MPLAFTDEMMDRLASAAALLPPNARGDFMRSVANRVGDLPYEAGLPEIEQAIAFVLNCRGISIGRATIGKKSRSISRDMDLPRSAREHAERHFKGVHR